ncbi:hypothetical protein [Roseomonas haemaphysalidis]|uniref:Uncharacterized protein n=1 Tax=Roseomonas haemaphysalidis TaxID=2768162 RepID=A0ABS3KUW2_9PROT|nr:hypothetical protein [Roseomonas haemaphysalidis]MBO1081264.1 hypothetical protein [Roseomonas haemaphysalidis]
MEILLAFVLASTQVINRFLLRMACIILFSFAYHGSDRSPWRVVSDLSFVTAFTCVVLALLLRERKFGDRLTNWDEAAAYITIGLIARAAVSA